MTDSYVMEAIKSAIVAESDAGAFYRDAAERTQDPGGAKMFLELADFEDHHRNHLERLRHSLESDMGWIAYEGVSLSKARPLVAGERAGSANHASALDALQLAIAAEHRAEGDYRRLSTDSSVDEAGRRLFSRLADEESMHRKILDDQYYALSNHGVWTWGD